MKESKPIPTIQITPTTLSRPLPLKIKPTQIPIKNIPCYSFYASNSSSFRQTKYKTAKESPEKNLNSEAIITESKEEKSEEKSEKKAELQEEPKSEESKEEKTAEDGPIDLEHRY